MFLVCFGFKFIVQVFRVKLVRKCKIMSLLNHLRDRKFVCDYGVMVQVVVGSCMWE